MAILLSAVVVTASCAGCAKKIDNNQADQFVTSQQKLSEYDGVITYHIDTKMDYTILGEGSEKDLDLSTTVKCIAKVEKNHVRYLNTDAATYAGDDSEAYKNETWYSPDIGKKYTLSVNKDIAGDNTETSSDSEQTWYMTDMDDFDVDTNELPERLNQNEVFAAVLTDALQDGKATKKKDAVTADISVSMKDLADAGITSALFLRSTPFAEELPDKDDDTVSGFLLGQIDYNASDNQLISAKMSFDADACQYMNTKYKDFGLSITAITIDVTAEYEDGVVLDLPEEVSKNAVEVQSNDGADSNTEEPSSMNEISLDAEGESELVKIDDLKDTLAKQYFQRKEITLNDLLDVVAENEKFLSDISELSLADGQIVYLKNSDVLDRLVKMINCYTKDDLSSAICTDPESEEENTYEYGMEFVALDILSQTGVFDDSLYENLATALFDHYDLITIDEVEKCAKENFSAFFNLF